MKSPIFMCHKHGSLMLVRAKVIDKHLILFKYLSCWRNPACDEEALLGIYSGRKYGGRGVSCYH